MLSTIMCRTVGSALLSAGPLAGGDCATQEGGRNKRRISVNTPGLARFILHVQFVLFGRNFGFR